MVTPQESMIDAEFTISYGGPAVTDNSMAVRDLAPSLLALNEVFARSNALLNGDIVSVGLRIRATRPGSLDIVLVLVSAWQAAAPLLVPSLVTSVVELKQLIIGGDGLFSMIKKLRGQRPNIVERHDGLYFKADNVEFRVSPEIIKIFMDMIVRQALPAVVRPLRHSGINRLTIKEEGKELESIRDEDVPSFDALITQDGSDQQVLTQNITETALKVITTNFDSKGNKWTLDDGGGKKSYAIQDQAFLKEVRQRERLFGTGEILICMVQTVQRQGNNGKIQIDRSILEVLDQMPPAQQLPLEHTRL